MCKNQEESRPIILLPSNIPLNYVPTTARHQERTLAKITGIKVAEGVSTATETDAKSVLVQLPSPGGDNEWRRRENRP